MTAGAQLKRRIGPGLLMAYGIGVMIGAGIYVLVGAVAGHAGIWSPAAFLVAGLIAAPTALSYAEYSTRLPEAAGEAAFVARGLGRRDRLLAGLTSAMLLAVFASVNLGLVVEKRRMADAPFRVPAAVPAFGLILSLATLSPAVGGLI